MLKKSSRIIELLKLHTPADYALNNAIAYYDESWGEYVYQNINLARLFN